MLSEFIISVNGYHGSIAKDQTQATSNVMSGVHDRLSIVGRKLVRDLAGNLLSSGLLELLAASVGDLLIGRAHLRGINLAPTELLLDGVESLVDIVLLALGTGVVAGAGA
jgi:hypothetical protein